MHINYRRGETRRKAAEYPYNNSGYLGALKADARKARRLADRKASRLAFDHVDLDKVDRACADARRGTLCI